MKVTYWLGGAFLIVLTACSSNQKSFNNMSAEEIYAYNLNRPIEDQVICQERRRSASRIRGNVCMTFQEMTEERTVGMRRLHLLNHRSSFVSRNPAHR
jgi:hypothetical protein